MPALIPASLPGRRRGDPNRPPYRGLRPLEADDAGIFFGRDAPIVEALDTLRGLRDGAPPRLLVILGASGAGKSSFLRAGLFPRLARDDQNFLPLPIIRPERAAITGETGLLRALEGAFEAARITMPRADLRAAIQGGAAKLKPLLQALADKATPPALEPGAKPKPPALVLSIDQGEELFLAEAQDEAQPFLALLRDLLIDRRARRHRAFSPSAPTTTNAFNSPRNWKACARKRSACHPCRRAPMPR